jgi:phosphatidyl-myo-inositol dimannoside synthase
VTDRVLLLCPSRGLGGGIERYVETLEWAFATEGVTFHRVDLRRPGAAAHVDMRSESMKHLRAESTAARIVVAHRALLPVASLLARDPQVAGVSVVCHGSDVWGTRLHPRWHIENHLMRRSRVRVVAVSSYTAGALGPGCQATVLPPGLSGEWFRELVGARAAADPSHSGISLVTAFRLADWKDKGLAELIDAVVALGRADLSLTVCGTGEPPPDLLRLVGAHSWCSVRAGLTDRELADQLAAADLFILATRTRSGRRPTGEGFGLVLLEAQLAGTPVVGPAHGGSRDAYAETTTGVTPTDESATALAGVLDSLLKDPGELRRMGARAADWARERFAPEKYAPLVVARLL